MFVCIRCTKTYRVNKNKAKEIDVSPALWTAWLSVGLTPSRQKAKLPKKMVIKRPYVNKVQLFLTDQKRCTFPECL